PTLADGIRVKAIVNQRIGSKVPAPAGKERRYSPRDRICSGISFGNSWGQNRYNPMADFHEQDTRS
ncbi:hypothetical protein E2986_12946, partial [Frieseomelitta varia]